MAVLIQIPRLTRILQPSVFSKIQLTLESCRQEEQKLWQMPNCPLCQLLGMEQEQRRHWDKGPCLVPHLLAVLGWSLVSWRLKDQGAVLLWLLIHPQGLQPALCLGQRHQRALTSVLGSPRELPCLRPLGSHSHWGWQLVLPREQVSLEPMDPAPA